MRKIRQSALPSFIAILIWYAFLLSCTNNTPKEFHPEYFDPIFKKFDSVLANTTQPDTQYLKQAFADFGQPPGIGDEVEKYRRFASLYANINEKLSLANLYCDSAIELLKNRTPKSKQLIELNVRMYFQKAVVYYKYEKYNESIVLYNTGKQLLSTDTTNCVMREYYEGLANLFYKQQRYQEALENFSKNYIISNNCLDGFYRFVYVQGNLDNIGICYDNLNMTDSALHYYNAALNYIEKEESSFPTRHEFVSEAKGVIYGNMAALYFRNNESSLGEHYAKLGIDITGRENQDVMSSFMILQLEHYLNQQKFELAQNIISKLEQIPAQHLNYLNNSRTFSKLKAQYYLLAKDTGKAFKAFEKFSYLKDSAEAMVKAIAPLNMQKEFNYAQEKLLNQNLQKDNQLKRTYLWLAVSLIVIVLLIVLMIANNLRRSRKNVEQLEHLNNQISSQNSTLKQTLTSLEQSHNENSQIIKTIAHDLKNPISGIKMLIQTLLYKEAPAEQKQILELVVNTCTNSLNMINELVGGNKSGRAIQKDFVNLAKLLKDVVWLLQAKATEKKQKIVISDHQVFVYVNHQMIWRLFSNIITNAIKFSTEGSKIAITITQENNTALVTVEDRGIGIPQELQENIFAIDNNASRPGTNGEVSYGLGLVISKRIVEDHYGRLWFTSTEGIGSTFYIELPMGNTQNPANN